MEIGIVEYIQDVTLDHPNSQTECTNVPRGLTAKLGWGEEDVEVGVGLNIGEQGSSEGLVHCRDPDN